MVKFNALMKFSRGELPHHCNCVRIVFHSLSVAEMQCRQKQLMAFFPSLHSSVSVCQLRKFMNDPNLSMAE